MDGIAINSLTALSSPILLVGYICAIVAITRCSGWLVGWLDGTRQVATPEVPADSDPLLTAWLKGGTDAVALRVVRQLLERGLLVQKTSREGLFRTRLLQQAPGAADLVLNPLERSVWAWFAENRAAASVLQEGLNDVVAPQTEILARRCQELQLTTSEEAQFARQLIQGMGIVAILAIGGSLAAFSLPAQTSTALLLASTALFGTLAQHNITRTSRLTDLGRRTLRGLEAAMGENWMDVKQPVAGHKHEVVWRK